MDKNNTPDRKKKQIKIAAIALAIVAVVILVVYITIDNTAKGLYIQGESIPKDIRTAEKINDDVVNILVCGIDIEEGRTGALTDVIMYVTLDVKAKKIAVFQIPRDTFIDDSVPTGGTNKINAVYSSGPDKKNQVFNIINVIKEKLGLSVDHYATLNMDAFISMVNAIENGFNMYVPCEVTLIDKKTGEEHTVIETPGWYLLDGVTTEQIVRNRNYPGGDVQRLEVQSYFYASIIKYFTENFDISDLIKVLPRFTQHITTDLHWMEVASLAQEGLGIAYENMVITKPAVEGIRLDGKDVLIAQEEQWLQMLNKYFRPYQDPLTDKDLKLEAPVGGEVTKNYGVVKENVQTIADMLNIAK